METRITYCNAPIPLSAFRDVMPFYAAYSVPHGSSAARMLSLIDKLFSRLAPDTDTGRRPSLWIEASPEGHGLPEWFEVASPEKSGDNRLIVSDKKESTLFIRTYDDSSVYPDRVSGKHLLPFLKMLYAYLSRVVNKMEECPGSYDAYLKDRLPYESRSGYVSRQDLYDICPEWRIRISDDQALLLQKLAESDGFSGEGLARERDLKYLENGEPWLVSLIRFRAPDGRWYVHIIFEEERAIIPAIEIAQVFESRKIPYFFSHIDEVLDVISGRGRVRVVPGMPYSFFDSPEICLPYPDDEISLQQGQDLIQKIEWDPFPTASIRK